MYDTAIYIGRFQPVHCGHLALLRRALECAPQVIVIVGSAWQARSPRNPFTVPEREALLRAALPEADQARVQMLPMRDHYDEARWAQAVQSAVERLVGGNGRIGLVGHFKDASSSYLDAFPGWELVHMPRQGDTDASSIRAAYLGADGAAAQAASAAGQMPPSSVQFLEDFSSGPHYPALKGEWHALQAHQAAWADAPYPPTFITVDALVRAQGQVLLIRRGHAPGEGMLALPGGFIGVHETLLQSCLRELAEETQCPLPASRLTAALQEVRVFAHPARSQRGRVVTHVHFFDFTEEPPFAVQAADDAAHALWVGVDELAALEAEFFDDHFHILDRFFGLLERPL